MELEKKLKLETLDGTLPCRETADGSINIITKTEAELCEIFAKYGFKFAEGFDIEEDFYNFTALNVKKNHPAVLWACRHFSKRKERYVSGPYSSLIHAKTY